MSMIVKLGKKGKQIVKKLLPAEKKYVGYTRRIERVKTNKRVCAMTFDDGPMDLPASPDRFGGRAMTDVLLDTLKEYGAHVSFDVVGDTSENYPDIHCDVHGGANHCDRLIRRMIDEGHQITNHGYRHVIFGKKPFVYGKRVSLDSLDAAVADLKRLDTLMRERYGYTLTMGRPPHYVDKIGDGFTSYDVYDRLGYQYMAASFDGAGWLPSTLQDPAAALDAEVAAMINPMRAALEADPDFFCGQIIFQKDGYNMGKRTPITFALGEQLKLLKDYGYEVVTVEQLMRESPFADVGADDPLLPKLGKLAETVGLAFTDNRVRLDQSMTWGQLAMLLSPKAEAMAKRESMIRKSGKAHPYAGALAWCAKEKLIDANANPDAPVTSLPEGRFDTVKGFTRRSVLEAYRV